MTKTPRCLGNPRKCWRPRVKELPRLTDGVSRPCPWFWPLSVIPVAQNRGDLPGTHDGKTRPERSRRPHQVCHSAERGLARLTACPEFPDTHCRQMPTARRRYSWSNIGARCGGLVLAADIFALISRCVRPRALPSEHEELADRFKSPYQTQPSAHQESFAMGARRPDSTFNFGRSQCCVWYRAHLLGLTVAIYTSSLSSNALDSTRPGSTPKFPPGTTH
jgi:hypothetical protein